MNRLSRAAALTAPALLLLSACGGSNGYGAAAPAATGSATPAHTGAGGGGGLRVASTSLGSVLVDGAGKTVYLLTADSPNRSTCLGSCLQYWLPVAPGRAAAAVTGPVGTTKTTDGSAIATVGGWPVYTFVQDASPGDVSGEGVASFGGTWYAVSPSGQPVKGASKGNQPASGPSAAPSSGRGY